MEDDLIKFSFDLRQWNYLQGIGLLDQSAKASHISVKGLEKLQVRLSRDVALEIGDKLSVLLAQIGFDENYKPTPDGEMIDSLIDSLFVE